LELIVSEVSDSNAIRIVVLPLFLLPLLSRLWFHCLFIYLSVSRITQKLFHQFSQNSTERWHSLDLDGNPDDVKLGYG